MKQAMLLPPLRKRLDTKLLLLGARLRQLGKRLKKDLSKNKYIYLMLIPVLAFYIVFKYIPVTKMVIAFQNYNIFKGISGSEWVGLDNFISFFQMRDFWKLIRNTLLLSLYSILFAFPVPILLALMINEVKHSKVKRVVQTVSYMPHFISLVVVCGILTNFCTSTGVINHIISFFNPSWSNPNLLGIAGYYRTIHIASSIWQDCGWDSIIYLATLSTIDPQLYEAAYIDGATKMKRILHITLPSLGPIITIQFIMRVGRVITVNYEKILLLYSPLTYDTADVISTYIYRFGLLNSNYSMGAAIGVFNSIISILILVTVNSIFRRSSENSLW